jgi:flagellar hook-length control protein FliK
MQILPENFPETTRPDLEFVPSAEPEDSPFLRELHKFLRDDGDGGDDGKEDALPVFLAEAPYNPVPEAKSFFTPQPARFTPAEVKTLASSLADDGVPSTVISALRDAAGTLGGPTAEALIRTAREALAGKTAPLDARDKVLLEGLTARLAGENGKKLLTALTGGTPREAADALLAGLEAGDAPISLDRDEALLLLKALGATESVAGDVLRAFGDSGLLTLKGSEWKTLLEPVREEAIRNGRDTDKLLAALEKHLPPLARDAAKREETERMAGMREDRSVSRTRLLIKDTATQAAPGRVDEPAQERQTRAVPRREKETGQKETGREEKNAAVPSGEEGGREAPARESLAPSPGGRSWEQASGRETPERDARQARDNGGARASSSQSSSQSSSLSPVLYAAVAQGVGLAASPDAGAPAQAPAPASLPAGALEQIERAFLTAGKNGVQRLEVALNPVELGSITVILTSRGSGVSALIQPDRAETSALILQQVEQIRAQLENQGFRVEKVEVQTQLADHNGPDWQGADQYNSSRDLQARNRELEYLRRLGRSGTGSSSLAQDMQLPGHEATIAGQGLHLIA